MIYTYLLILQMGAVCETFEIMYDGKTEKSFSPIGCAVIDKYFRIVSIIITEIVNKCPRNFSEQSTKLSTKLSRNCL